MPDERCGGLRRGLIEIPRALAKLDVDGGTSSMLSAGAVVVDLLPQHGSRGNQQLIEIDKAVNV